MKIWQKKLNFDPITSLDASKNPIIKYFVHRDLLEEEVDSIQTIWHLPVIQKILKKQQPNGSWKSRNINQIKYPLVNYSLIETWKQFRYLIEQYELNRTDPSVERAAEYIFSCQTEDGDIRGMLANQYATYYTGAFMSLLIKAGYETDPRIEKGFEWLLSVRQNDGGWLASPLMSLNLSKDQMNAIFHTTDTIMDHDLTKPSSHNWTGMVIRAFATHPIYRKSTAAQRAAILLKTHFFQKDKNYSSYKAADYWVKFQYPYWWNNLVAALDSISSIGFSKDDKDIKNALNWLIDNQQENGLWKLSYSEKKKIIYNQKAKEEQLWVSLVICRILKRFYNA